MKDYTATVSSYRIYACIFGVNARPEHVSDFLIWADVAYRKRIAHNHGSKENDLAGDKLKSHSLLAFMLLSARIEISSPVCSKIEGAFMLQESFDEIVKENMDTFDMTVSMKAHSRGQSTHDIYKQQSHNKHILRHVFPCSMRRQWRALCRNSRCRWACACFYACHAHQCSGSE